MQIDFVFVLAVVAPRFVFQTHVFLSINFAFGQIVENRPGH